MEHLVLRPFAADDIEAVIDLLQDVSAYRPPAQALADLARSFTDLGNSHACVAVLDGRVVAFGSLFVLNRVRGGRSGIIEDMAVSKAVRGQGIGRRVVENLLEQARASGCFKVSLEASASAEPFYQSTGFAPAGQVMKFLL